MSTQKIQIAIKASPEQVWDALINPKVTPQYYIGGFEADFDLEAGRPYRYLAGGHEVITGTVLEVEPGRSLTTTFNARWDADVADLPESTVHYSIIEPNMPTPGVTFLSLVHEDLPDTELAAGLELGWVTILSSLKTLLETETPMVTAPH